MSGKKKASWFSKLVVLLVIVLATWFADRVLQAFVIVGTEPVILIGAWFSTFLGELWLLANLSNTKTKQKGLIDCGKPLDTASVARLVDLLSSYQAVHSDTENSSSTDAGGGAPNV